MNGFVRSTFIDSGFNFGGTPDVPVLEQNYESLAQSRNKLLSAP